MRGAGLGACVLADDRDDDQQERCQPDQVERTAFLDGDAGQSEQRLAEAEQSERSGEGEDKQTLLLGVTTAYTLIMPAGVQIKIDDGEPISLQYDLCFPTSCQGELELTKDMFEKMRKGKLMVVAAMNMQQKALAFPVPLTDFGKTFDGPRADNAKYEEAQRQMMETIRQRQIDLANKVADQKKMQGGEQPQAGAPQAGTQVPAQPPPR